MKSKTGLLLTIASLFLWLNLGWAQALPEDTTVEVEGIGINREDALLKAKRRAVEAGVGIVLISETEIKNFELQKDVILTKTVGSVKHYDIIAEKMDSDGVVSITIRAVVSLAQIKADLAALKILLESMDKPRMMVLIQEAGEKTAENTIVAYLQQKGFDVVDAATAAAQLAKGEAFVKRAASGDPAAAAQLGAQNGAEFIITGKVLKSVKENALLSDSGMISGQAAITARAVNCSNARVVASASTSSAAYHVSDAVAMSMAAEKAAQRLMNDVMFEKIVATFQDMVNNGILLDVTVNQVPNYRTQKTIQERLATIAGTVSVSKKAFGGGRLLLSVQFKGTADTFSEAVDGQPVAGGRLSVTDISAGKVGMVLE